MTVQIAHQGRNRRRLPKPHRYRARGKVARRGARQLRLSRQHWDDLNADLDRADPDPMARTDVEGGTDRPPEGEGTR